MRGQTAAPDVSHTFVHLNTGVTSSPSIWSGSWEGDQKHWEKYMLKILEEASDGTLRGKKIDAGQRATATRLLRMYRNDPSKFSGMAYGVDLGTDTITPIYWAR